MATRDLSALFQDGALEYPSVPSRTHPKGKTYRVPSPDGRTGLYLTQLAEMGIVDNLNPAAISQATEVLRLDDDEEREFLPLVLGCTEECRTKITRPAEDEDDEPIVEKGPPCGSAFDQMMADGVAWTHIQTIGQDAFMCFGINEAFADAVNMVTARPDESDEDAEGKAPAPANRAQRRNAAKKTPAKKTPAKKQPSARKGGSSSNRASGAASTRTSRARTRGSNAPDPATAEARTA